MAQTPFVQPTAPPQLQPFYIEPPRNTPLQDEPIETPTMPEEIDTNIDDLDQVSSARSVYHRVSINRFCSIHYKLFLDGLAYFLNCYWDYS